ncbi:heat shock factor-binding protein 1 isoform X2 [Rhipicephalus sanguineus]|uniref:heat shock factor-binding protein 1 isoform X2 n=1 Tax=Rhipicephalus sanguineus TaxID=34632 RepID=UPI001895813B|nr:heat shock factor-binding protein 1 isoform X2 [Rhipicephalus sanguineus]XP_049267624.1 heat shock factor-binding protein 1 isoform X2 [Rhipicephalus sanguineus]
MAEQSGYSSGKNQDSKSDLNKSTSGGDHVPDPKNIQDLTQYVTHHVLHVTDVSLPAFMLQAEESVHLVQTLLQQMQDKFQVMSDQILTRIDEMGHRIDDLERNITDLMSQAGVEEADK